MGGILSRRRFNAVDDVSFTLEAGRPEIFTIIGELGSGKTTLARMILNMVAPSAGVIRFRGSDLGAIRGRREQLAFMQKAQPIFQNPFEAFNPVEAHRPLPVHDRAALHGCAHHGRDRGPR